MSTIPAEISAFKRYIARAIGLPIIVQVVFAALLIVQVSNLLSATRWVDHSDRVIAQANRTLNLLIDAETGQRGFLVGGNQVYLQPYRTSVPQIEPEINRLAKLTASSPTESQRAAALRGIYPQWLREVEFEMRLRRQASASPVFRQYFNQARGKVLMDRMRVQIASIILVAQYNRDVRSRRVQQEAQVTLAGVLVGAVILGILIGLNAYRQTQKISDQYEGALRAEHKSAEMFQTTLLSIGDAVLVTDAAANIVQMNAVAEELTGWRTDEARGRPASDVFRIFNETTREKVQSPIDRVIKEGAIVGLANHTVLISKDGRDIPIDDSGAPIFNDERVLIGTVLVFRDITERKEAEAVQKRLREIAEQRAIEMEREYSKEHRIAEALQRSLLARPSPNAYANLEVETLYRPAWDEAQVGGDFYDLFALDAGKVAMVVGDVSGKGLEAAARTAEIKYTLRAYLREHSVADSAMERLNQFLCEAQQLANDPSTYFLCLTLAVIDTLTGEVSLCVAGAEPPLHIRHEAEVRYAQASGFPLGILPKAEYETHMLILRSGDMLLIATDGITEARRSGGEMLGLNGLATLVEECRVLPSLSGIGNHILEYATTHSGGTLKDDACILLARRL